jgi:hypothetical protein
MRRSLRRARLRPCVAVLVVPAVLAVVPLAGAAGDAAPKGSQPVTILYTGTFTMSNVAQPQTTAASYTYSVTWTYWWTGTWSSLFRDPSVFSSPPAAFTKVKIAGRVDSTYKLRVDDPSSQTCTSKLVADRANRPSVRASYDTSANTLQLVVEAPTFRGAKHTSTDFNCQNGPGSNVFGPGTSQTPPASFNPLGAGGTVKLSTGGTTRYDGAWSWRHTFASASGQVPFRAYKAQMRSGVTVYYRPCRLITACARAKP